MKSLIYLFLISVLFSTYLCSQTIDDKRRLLQFYENLHNYLDSKEFSDALLEADTIPEKSDYISFVMMKIEKKTKEICRDVGFKDIIEMDELDLKLMADKDVIEWNEKIKAIVDKLFIKIEIE